MRRRLDQARVVLGGLALAVVLAGCSTAGTGRPAGVPVATTSPASPEAVADQSRVADARSAAESSAAEQAASAQAAAAAAAAAEKSIEDQAAADQAAADQAAADAAAREAEEQAARDQEAVDQAAREAAEQAVRDQQAADAAAAQEAAEQEAAQQEAAQQEADAASQGWYTPSGNWVSPQTAARALAAGIAPGETVPNYLRCGTICGEGPTSGEVQWARLCLEGTVSAQECAGIDAQAIIDAASGYSGW